MEGTNDSRSMLRHAVATLAYRCGKAVRDAPAGFGELKISPETRTPSEILGHIADLFDWALSISENRQAYKVGDCESWESTADRFFASVAAFDAFLGSEAEIAAPVERLFQGPVADALTHTGQLTMMRHIAGLPVRGENYFVAEIQSGSVGPNQAPARYEFD